MHYLFAYHNLPTLFGVHQKKTVIQRRDNLTALYRGSYMSAHYHTSWGKVIKCEASRALYHFFATSVINSIIQEHEC